MTRWWRFPIAGAARNVSGGSLIPFCAVLAFLLPACGSMTLSFDDAPTATTPEPAPRYSIIFIIHGDGDYVYHDARGQPHRADKRTLRAAMLVARQRTDAEVCIFHQRPSFTLMYLIPLPDGEFQYYRGGALKAREPYWRSTGAARFEAESVLYHKYAVAAERANIMLYFGHEIPEMGGMGYDVSTPERVVNIHAFSAGLKGFMPDSTRFDLLVLSTCFGGTPLTIAALAPYARTIIASPGNLHLSYFDLRAFGSLEKFRGRDNVRDFAPYFARQAFRQLSADVQTAVTVAVYESDRVNTYLAAAGRTYAERLRALQDSAASAIEYVDCGEEESFVLPGMRDGVSVLFRPSRFGREKNKPRHSGWQCCRAVAW